MPVFRQGERKYLFIHVPKTGGSSVERAFANAGHDTLYLDGRSGKKSWNYIRRCSPQHMHGDMLEAIFSVDKFDGVFTVVRDPMSRLKSEYLWQHRNVDVSIDGPTVEKWALSTFARYGKDPFIFDNHIRPQADFILERALVFRFEDGLDRMAEALNEKWNLELPAQLPRVREGGSATTYSSKDVVVTNRLRKLVRTFYRKDYRQFGYRP